MQINDVARYTITIHEERTHGDTILELVPKPTTTNAGSTKAKIVSAVRDAIGKLDL